MPFNSIQLINCNEEIIEALLKGDKTLATHLNINIPTKWSEFGTPIFEYSLAQIKNNPNSAKWWTYLPILITENTLVGSCGYKGAPSEAGMVEIGYEVAEIYRNRGLATEIAKLLVQQAFEDDKVKIIQAHTIEEANASTRVLEKCGFKKVGSFEDEEEGLVWKWELMKN
ncbi:MAG: GNAT family N-acetyltransferase [Chitinophagales bacterium]